MKGNGQQKHEPWTPMVDFDRDTVFVDVDGTLLIWPTGRAGEGQPIRNLDLCLKLQAWKTPDRRIYVWSKGGHAHARRAVEFCELGDIVSGCLEKPTRMVDDSFAWLDKVRRESP